MSIIAKLNAVVIAGVLLVCATAGHAGDSRVQKGDAVYYSNEFQGDGMACGGTYQPEKMVAAHRKLECGTLVKVKNRATGEVVRVRIKDRGPYGDRDTIIDVSRRAAKKLGFWGSGRTRVRVEVVGGS